MYYYDDVTQTFFTEKLLSVLSNISVYGITIAEAPRNFGKTTALKHYYLNSKHDVRIELSACISQPLQFYRSIVSLLMPHSAFKYDTESCNSEKELLSIFSNMSFSKKVLLYINNARYFTYNTLNIIILNLSRNMPSKLSIILEVRSPLFEKSRFEKYTKTVNYIGYKEFLFSDRDITDYFSLYSLNLSQKAAELLLDATNGWLPSVRLHLNRLLLLKEFSSDFNSDKIVEFLYGNNTDSSLSNINILPFSGGNHIKDFLESFMENQFFINDVITKLIDSKTNCKLLDSSDMFRYISDFVCDEPSVKLGSYGLTPRELEISFLVSKRYSNKEIARSLCISESTVKSYLKIIFRKVDIKSRKELFDIF
ncbi:MAG: helix-turn-helix transcriptional regulator [Firmicutes bacterium]|nr:helix-turn-helix transcriptional regulator [Bacillota bacterium]